MRRWVLGKWDVSRCERWVIRGGGRTGKMTNDSRLPKCRRGPWVGDCFIYRSPYLTLTIKEWTIIISSIFTIAPEVCSRKHKEVILVENFNKK